MCESHWIRHTCASCGRTFSATPNQERKTIRCKDASAVLLCMNIDAAFEEVVPICDSHDDELPIRSAAADSLQQESACIEV